MTQTKYDKAVSVCFSGHRNIPFLYRKQLKLQLKAAITKAYAGGYRHFYCGCAMGFDMLAAEVALALQSELSGLQVIAVVPYRGQSERWNDAMKARYDTILCNSDDVIILSEHYYHGCLLANAGVPPRVSRKNLPLRLSSVFFRISLVRLFPPPFGGRKINPKGRKQAEKREKKKG